MVTRPRIEKPAGGFPDPPGYHWDKTHEQWRPDGVRSKEEIVEAATSPAPDKPASPARERPFEDVVNWHARACPANVCPLDPGHSKRPHVAGEWVCLLLAATHLQKVNRTTLQDLDIAYEKLGQFSKKTGVRSLAKAVLVSASKEFLTDIKKASKSKRLIALMRPEFYAEEVNPESGAQLLAYLTGLEGREVNTLDVPYRPGRHPLVVGQGAE